ncbi:uncharacterized protein A4U43_C05F31560, partial [Asparagus officinalis]
MTATQKEASAEKHILRVRVFRLFYTGTGIRINACECTAWKNESTIFMPNGPKKESDDVFPVESTGKIMTCKMMKNSDVTLMKVGESRISPLIIKMSGTALRDLNVLPISGLEKKSDGSSKGGFTKPNIENNIERRPSKVSASLSSAPVQEAESVGNGVEAGNLEIEYIESENLPDLPSVDTSLSTLLAKLDSKNWVLVCEALNNVRQISLYHKEKLLDILGDVIPLLVKSLKSPRSAVCKTAIMTSADIFKVYGDSIVDSLDLMLVQLLLKASQDKRFVCEAAVTALISMTTWVSPSLLLPKLLPYLKNKNPRIRAKTSMCFGRTVPQLV